MIKEDKKWNNKESNKSLNKDNDNSEKTKEKRMKEEKINSTERKKLGKQ